jgi:hypothetical protein
MWSSMASAIPYPDPKPLLLTLLDTIWYRSIRHESYLQFYSSSITNTKTVYSVS